MTTYQINQLRGAKEQMAGYLSRPYAKSLAEFGQARHLSKSNGWIVERQIPGTALVDGIGCYPLFCCVDWQQLQGDLQELRRDLVSLALVADPFGNFQPDDLQHLFDRVVPFKDHYVVETARFQPQAIKRSHRESVRRALKTVSVRICPEPGSYLNQWVKLFSHLAERHSIKGLRAFSPKAFECQLNTPGLVMFEALVGDETVGLDLWYVQGDVAYGHLVAFNEVGYKNRASYATKWTILNYFKDRVRWVDLGGTPGTVSGTQSGLASFKSGWATGTKMAYFCGIVLRTTEYQQLVTARGLEAGEYFPAYRAGEFS